MAVQNKTETPTLTLERLSTKRMLVPVVGTTPLIVHNFSEKAKRQMLEAMQGVKRQKERKDPDAEYKSALYLHDDGGYGFPAVAFKAATVSAVRHFGQKGFTMVKARGMFFFGGEFSKVQGQSLVRIEGEPHCREDVVTVGMGGKDLRYRPQFDEWATWLDVSYLASELDQTSVLALIEAGGALVGVGEWRPERNGDFGRYQIDESREVKMFD